VEPLIVALLQIHCRVFLKEFLQELSIAEISDHLVTIDMGQKVLSPKRAAVPFLGRAGFPFNIM